MSNILGSQELINGYTQQELADRWVAQAFSTPVEEHPFFATDPNDPDKTPLFGSDDLNPQGTRGTIELHDSFQSQSPDGVYFLGGVFGGDGQPIVRTIVEQSDVVYFAPFANQTVDNTTFDFAPTAPFSGGYALTPQHSDDLSDQGLNAGDASAVVGEPEGSLPTLLDIAQYIADNFGDQFAKIDDGNVTLGDIEDYRQETEDLSYSDLPRSTGAVYSADIFVADPDLGENLENDDPSDDVFPTLGEINPTGNDFVVPFVQAGYYFGLQLDSGAHTVQFGDSNVNVSQDITYNILNRIEGNNCQNYLRGTKENDYINGENGGDVLVGRGGDDLLIGGKGKDLLIGGRGHDELWGDEGKDTFVFKRGYGQDAIYDLESGEFIALRGFCQDPKIENVTLGSGAEATRIAFNDHDVLTLVGVQVNEVCVTEGAIFL